ncbi:MAG TPA: ParB/RepB/Spo0J family partition protein, partial [Thermoleophilaceae bacterium]|nr:ParB/RepB/Spo0J family partition protein [Thermoleophilaceae bacterium]
MAEEHGGAAGRQPRGMGRGLAAILPRSQADQDGLRELPLELVHPNPDQPRSEFDGEALLALAEAIKARGVLQPVVGRALPGGTYELLAGERRLRASRLAGLDRIPALVRRAGEGERLELALIENMAREDLNPIESARACATLVEDLGITKEELGRRLGRSRATVSNLIRLLELPDEVLSLIASGQLSEGHGRAI